MKTLSLFPSIFSPVLRRVITRQLAGWSRLNDHEWRAIHDLFPVRGHGGQWREQRQVADGLLLMAEGYCATWRDLPSCYGPWQTVYWRFRQYEQNGTLAQMQARLPGRDLRSVAFVLQVELTRHVGLREREVQDRLFDVPGREIDSDGSCTERILSRVPLRRSWQNVRMRSIPARRQCFA